MTYPVDTEVITYKRRKVKGKRQVLLSQFKAEEVHHRLEDCTCPDCHGELKEIGASLPSTPGIGFHSSTIKAT